MNSILFEEYNMNQLILPMDFSDSIPKNHAARAVSTFVDGIDPQVFLEAYEGGGRPAYHPRMMTKILLYAYTQKCSEGDAIEKTIKEF